MRNLEDSSQSFGMTRKHLNNNGIMMSKLSILSELWEFLKVRKKWWLLPIILFLVLLGGLIILTQGSALAPFIYAIF